MKQIYILTLFVLSALVMQGCKKDDDSDTTDTTTSTATFQAYINSTVWTPDTLSATITYNAATKTKVLACTGTKTQKRIVFTVKQTSATNDNTFPVATYNVDATGNVVMSYYKQQLVSAGVYDFVLYGTAQPGSGSVIVTSIDATNKTITGTYSFTATKVNYDSNGNYVSVDAATISSGVFNAMPYTFVSN